MEISLAHKKKILVIGDAVAIRHTLALIFQRAGYIVKSVINSEAALDFLQAQEFDLVILDIIKIDQNGCCLLPEITRAHPDLPVIVLTAVPHQESMYRTHQNGGCNYLLKPINPECIMAAATQLMDKSPKSIPNSNFMEMK
jgi:DNA-binding NtrC family response regulator